MSVIVGPTSGTPVFIRRLPFYRGGGAAAFANAYSILLDGVNEAISHGNNYAFERTDAFSIAAWWKATSAGSTQVIFGRQGDGGNYRGYSFGTHAGQYRLELTNADGSNRIHLASTGLAFSNNTWYFGCMTYDGSSTAAGAKFYHCAAGGVPSATGLSVLANNLSLTMIEAGLNAYQGRAKWGGYFGGNIDSTTIWNAALTLAQVQELAATIDVSTVSFWANRLGWYENGDDGDTTAAFANRANPGFAIGAGENLEAGDIVADVRA
jgi:hypothetical protein